MKSLALSAVGLFSFAVLLLPAHAKTELETSMKSMADAAHQLRDDLKLTDDTKHAKDVDLQSVATMKTESAKAHNLTPAKEDSLPPDQKPAMTQDYQKDMEAFSKDIDVLGHDIQGNNWAAARTDYQKLMDDEKAGHKAYRVKKP